MPRGPLRARHGGRGLVRRLLQGAVALGGDCLLCPVRVLWRALRLLRSKKARRDSAAAAMARRHMRVYAQPAGEPLLRRALARARGAVDAMLRPGRRALAVGRDFLQRVLRLLPEFLRCLQPPPHKGSSASCCRRPHAPSTSLPPPKGYARMYEDDPRRRRPRAPSTSLPPPPPPPQQHEDFTVDDEKVPVPVVRQYAFYCKVFSERQSNSEVCHFCVFDWRRSPYFTAKDMADHCRYFHKDIVPTVPCDEPGCSVRLRPGRELALHKYFFHVEAPDWWHKYT